MHLLEGLDRRLSSRFNVAIPFRYRDLNSSEPEESAESINISERGLYFETDSAPVIGTELQLCLAMPEEIIGKLPEEWSCIGHVVRRGPGMYNADRFGVAVCLDCFESFKDAADGVSFINNKSRRKSGSTTPR
jgi:hypothetical protein